jgi:intergrase/recombinase
VTIGLNSLHTTPDYDRGASDLAQKKCRSIFRPLIAVLLERSKFIMQNLFKTVISYMSSNKKYSMFSAFFTELQTISEQFVENVLLDVKKKTNDEFDTFTKIMDWDLMGFCSSPQNLG